MRNYQRDGTHRTDDNQGKYLSSSYISDSGLIAALFDLVGAPNYFPNSFAGPLDQAKHVESSFEVSGKCERYNTRDDDNFTQAGNFWRTVLKPDERERLASNIADHLKGASEFIRARAIDNFTKVDGDLGKRIRDKIQGNTVIASRPPVNVNQIENLLFPLKAPRSNL